MIGLGRNRVTYYDTSSLFKVGFYLNGFHRHGRAQGYRLSVKHRVPPHLREALGNSDWRHSLFASSLFGTTVDGKDVCFCIDTHDLNDIETIRGNKQGFHLPLLEKVDAYFKVNYNRERIENIPVLREHQHKIFPVNQFISLKSPRVLPFMLWLPPTTGGYNANAPYEKLSWRIRERSRHLRNWVTLDELIAYRTMPKDLDVFFVTSFRHGKRHREDMDRRFQLVEGIQGLANVKALTGLANYRQLTGKFAKYAVKSMRQAVYLENLARARIVIYTRGMDDCLASKFALFQALGLCVVGHTVKNNTDLIDRFPHLKKQFAHSTTDSIVRRVEELVTDRQQTNELAAKNVEVFDSRFSPTATAEQVLATLDARLYIKAHAWEAKRRLGLIE